MLVSGFHVHTRTYMQYIRIFLSEKTRLIMYVKGKYYLTGSFPNKLRYKVAN